jgi:glucose-6-phosphate 1-dehydrogenase
MPTAPPSALVIFGASGDLAKRKLLPAVYELAREKLLPEQFALVGYARSEMSDEQFRAEFKQAVEKFARTKPVDPAVLERLAGAVYYHTGDYGSADAHAALARKLEEIDNRHGTSGNRLFWPRPRS